MRLPSQRWHSKAYPDVRSRHRTSAKGAFGEADASKWSLPSVDKDVSTFHGGFGSGYAWVQTSETLYIFSPVSSDAVESSSPNVELSLENEGTMIRFVVEGHEILNGLVAHPLKPGNEIWMIEDAPDGRSFAVAELDKVTLGIEWTSVMHPKVAKRSEYSNPVVQQPFISVEEQAQTVQATLDHLQKAHRSLRPVDEGRLAVLGDVLTVDIQGFELAADNTRGQPLNFGSASGTLLELGAPGYPKEMQDALVGIAAGETRDVQVMMGQRAGTLGGRKIICAVTCSQIQEQVLPNLDDEFARRIKQDELFKQAGTAEGIREDEKTAETFTLEDLKAEISAEVRQSADSNAATSIRSQLEEMLRSSFEVSCDWASLGEDGVLAEELAAITSHVAENEGLAQKIDMDAINRETWDTLAIPDKGESIKEVGKDPARDYQAVHRKVLRRKTLQEVLRWLEDRMQVAS